MPAGKTPMWPHYQDRTLPNRTLAVLDGSTLHLEDKRAIQLTSFDMFVNVMMAENILAFTQTLTDETVFPWLDECVQSPLADVNCGKTGHATSIRIKRKSQSRWVVPASTWERFIDDTFLQDMRELYNHLGIVKPTPSSLGQALLRKSFKENFLPHHTAPNQLARAFLRKHGTGGRCDLLVAPGEFYPKR
jgi:hypothetical protein